MRYNTYVTFIYTYVTFIYLLCVHSVFYTIDAEVDTGTDVDINILSVMYYVLICS